MTLPDLYESSRSKAARAHRRALTPKIIASIQKTGVRVMLLDKGTGHHRLTLSSGLLVDFWVTTLRWEMVGGRGVKGDGMTGLYALIADPPPPPTAASPTEGLVCVFADGSFNHRTGDAGWGAVLAGKDGVWKEVSGRLEDCSNSMEAELMAMANGLEAAITRDMLQPGGVVMLQSDCTGALSIILGFVPKVIFSQGPSDIVIHPARRLHKAMRASRGLEMLRRLATAHRLKVIIRHNRGHTNKTNRGKISNTADRLAAAASRGNA